MKTRRPKQDVLTWRTPRPIARHGLSSVLAMLYLLLFSTLAVGFYGATTMSAQIARNEQAANQANAAADGGMQFIRYQLGQLIIPPTVTTDQLLSTVATQLGAKLNGTSNMNGHTVQITDGTIYIPAADDWTMVDASVGTKFRAAITQSGAFLVANIDGAGPRSTMMRGIQLQYQKAPRAGAILDYGVASRGTIATGGASYIQGLTDPTKGSVLSADMTSSTPVVLNGKAVSGDVSVVNPSATVSVGAGTSVGGTSNPTQIPNHIHIGVPAPTFQWIDTSPFTAYATNTFNPVVMGTNNTTLTDIIIPPNTNPQFSGNATINGVLYIQTPNVVTFKGNATVNGVIVTDNSGTFNATNNKIVFGGTVAATPLSKLPTSNPAYDPNLVKLTGSFLLAPNYAVSFSGNFGTIGGSIVAGQVSMTGNATGEVQGSVIGMQDVPMTVGGSADIVIASTGTTNYPTGMSFGNNYTPLPGTYLEVAPW